MAMHAIMAMHCLLLLIPFISQLHAIEMIRHASRYSDHYINNKLLYIDIISWAQRMQGVRGRFNRRIANNKHPVQQTGSFMA